MPLACGDAQGVTSELSAKRGRIIPTTPWESIWSGVAEWYGVEGSDKLASVVPNAKNFGQDVMFSKETLFGSSS